MRDVMDNAFFCQGKVDLVDADRLLQITLNNMPDHRLVLADRLRKPVLVGERIDAELLYGGINAVVDIDDKTVEMCIRDSN